MPGYLSAWLGYALVVAIRVREPVVRSSDHLMGKYKPARDVCANFGIPNLPELAWPSDNGKVAENLLWFYANTQHQRFMTSAGQALD
jgi:hypothetical protein